jgi:hypothetical protein
MGYNYRNVPHPVDTPDKKLDSLSPRILAQAASVGKFLKRKGVAALLGRAEDTPMCKRYELHDVPTGSVSEIVITEVGWYLLKQGATRAEKE